MSKYLKHLGLATRQFIALALLSTIMFIALFLLGTRLIDDIFRQQLQTDSQLFMNDANQYLDAYVSNVDYVLLLISSNYMSYGNSPIQIESKLANNVALSNGIVRTIYVVLKSGTVYSSNQVAYDILGNPNIHHLVSESEHSPNTIVSSQPYNSIISGKTISFSRRITNDKGIYLGTAVIEIDLQQLQSDLSNVLPDQLGDFILLTSNGSLITFNASEALTGFETQSYPPGLDSKFLRQISHLSRSVQQIDSGHAKYIALKSDTNYLGWDIVSIVDQHVFDRDLALLTRYYWILGSTWILVLGVITFFFSRYFTKPVSNLAETIDQINDFTKPDYVFIKRTDEVGILAKSFNRMLNRIQMLLIENQDLEQRKTEYEVKMLQSQISPHFMYNTLACISSLIRSGRTSDASVTIHSLVNLISFSFDKTSPFITIEDELNVLSMFLQIQRVRYGDRFTLQVHLPQQAMACYIPKLTLQPLVENSIFHGILPNEDNGIIKIYSRLRSNTVHLYVLDNGVGFGPQPSGTVDRRLNKIGLKNIHERIQLYYGSEFGLKVKSRQGVGTLVRVIIPYNTNASISDGSGG